MYASLPLGASSSLQGSSANISISKDVNATIITTPSLERKDPSHTNPDQGFPSSPYSNRKPTKSKPKDPRSPFFGSVRKLWRLSLIQEEGDGAKRKSVYDNTGVVQSSMNLSSVQKPDAGSPSVPVPLVQRSVSHRLSGSAVPPRVERRQPKWEMVEDWDSVSSSDQSSRREDGNNSEGSSFVRGDKMRRSYDVIRTKRQFDSGMQFKSTATDLNSFGRGVTRGTRAYGSFREPRKGNNYFNS